MRKALFYSTEYKSAALIFLCLIAAVLTSCSTASGKTGETLYSDGISARGAIGRVEAAFSGPVFEGDGGADIRLAVLVPDAHGDVPGYLPLYVQGLLNNNFNKYSAVTLIDRQNLDRIISEQGIMKSGNFSDTDFIALGNLTNTQYFLFGTIQKLSGERYSLQLSVMDSTTGIRRANFMGDGPLNRFEGSGALINEASAELLENLGVRLTEGGKRTLLAGNRTAVQAQAGLARGITAQAEGSQIEALFNFSQSIAFDPSQIEALTRLNLLSNTISEGTISQRIVSDFEARDRWLDAFRETANFFNDHPPFEIIFDPNLVQDGEPDYVKRTANIGMRIALNPSEAGFGALNALLEGLEKTGRRSAWGFAGWPLLEINPRTAGTVVFGGKRSFSFKVDVALLNENDITIGKNSLTLKSGTMRFSAGNKQVPRPNGDMGLLRFPNVKVDELTPTLTIVITAVNGIPSAQLNAAGYMRIDAEDLEGKVAFKEGAVSANFVHINGGTFIMGSFVHINGGTFIMGSPENEPGRRGNEGPQRQVTVSSFSMGKYQVTQKEWVEVMGSNPSRFKGDNLPVEQVSWFDVVDYCNRRSQKEGLTPAYTISGSGNNRTVIWNRNTNGYRLPTEAEWEYACRAGTTTAFNTGASITDNTGWYRENSSNRTHPVGLKPANAWGLHDMHGNVFEWCWDWFGIYSFGAHTDPVGAVSGNNRVVRGGNRNNYAPDTRSAYRGSYNPSHRHDVIGFRVVRS